MMTKKTIEVLREELSQMKETQAAVNELAQLALKQDSLEGMRHYKTIMSHMASKQAELDWYISGTEYAAQAKR